MSEKDHKTKQGQIFSLRFEDDRQGAATSGQVGPKSSKRPHEKFREHSAQTAPSARDGGDPGPTRKPHERLHEHSARETPPPLPEEPELIGIYKNNDDGDTPKTAKKPHSKFREYSNQAAPSERLKQDPPPSGSKTGAAKPDKKALREDKRLHSAKLRMEKTGGKLEKAVDKKAKQKPYKKPGAIKSVGRMAVFEARHYVHKKIHENEHENVGVEAAHKTELAGERVVQKGSRFVKNRIRTRPARRVRKWQKRDVKAKANFQYKKMVQENPALKKNAVSRYLQKQKLKRRYQKQAKEAAKKSAKAAAKATKTTAKTIWAVVKFTVSNPKVLLIVLIAALLIVILYSCVGTFTMMSNGVTGVVGASSYHAADADIDMAELAYTEWETDLQLQINNMEATRPGYDEYRYNIGTISHNPYELMAFLTAVYQDFTYPGVESVLQAVFNEQYTLTTREITETRETEDEDGEAVTEEYRILEITLTVKPFTDIIHSRMTAEQQEHFNLLLLIKGNRQYWQSPFLVWLPNVTDNYGYRVHPIRGDKDYHMGIDIAMPEGTVIYAAQAGTVTFADNSGGYGLVVVIDDGAGLVSKYAHCSALLVSAGQTVNAGDPIAKVGSTGSSTGNHLHMELIKDGKYLNPLFFALTNDFGELPEYGGNPGVAYDDATFQKIMDEATKHIGRAYVWGGSSPSTGFDCSGFVCWVYRVSGVYDMGRITALGIYSHCARVTDPKPGDLVFFERTYSTTSPITHVGIYVGGGKMLHCGDPIGYADLSSNYWRSHFVAYGRLPIN